MDVNRPVGFPPDSNRTQVARRISSDYSDEMPTRQGGFLGALAVARLSNHPLLNGSTLRILVATSAALVSVIAVISWWSKQPETLNDSAIPTVSSTRSTVLGAGSPPSSAQPDIVVHVAGAVVSPGVVSVAPGSRVSDAVDAAGGPTPEADLHRLNLAQILQDGTSVVIPAVGQEIVDQPIRPPALHANGGEGQTLSNQVNINIASVDELQQLNGVGPATAASIVEWRDSNGAFSSVDDLLAVPGIGPAKLAAMRDDIVV